MASPSNIKWRPADKKLIFVGINDGKNSHSVKKNRQKTKKGGSSSLKEKDLIEGPYPAPENYKWEMVSHDDLILQNNGSPIVILVPIL